jgi:hypothetical protein
MGQISSHPFPSFSDTDTDNAASAPGDSGSGCSGAGVAEGGRVPPFPAVPRSQPLQYRLESNTVKVFPKGTGRGFL